MMDSFRKLFSIGGQQHRSPTRPATPEEVRRGGEYLLELKKKDVIQNLEKETGLMPYYVGGFCLAGSMIPFISRKKKGIIVVVVINPTPFFPLLINFLICSYRRKGCGRKDFQV